MLEYKISVRDTSLRTIIPDNGMILYTNDTVSRTENFTESLGKQVNIRHMEFDKAYILVETEFGNYAIQQPQTPDSLKSKTSYRFKKKCGKRKILGMKAKRYLVDHNSFEEPIEFLYLKNYSNKYLNNFSEIPGLLVKFSVVTPDAILDYELIRFNPYEPNRDLFGIPSDYKRVSLDDFLDIMLRIRQENTEKPKEGN